MFKLHVTGFNIALQDITDTFKLSCHLFAIILFCVKLIYLSHKTKITANISYAQQSSYCASAVVYTREPKFTRTYLFYRQHL